MTKHDKQWWYNFVTCTRTQLHSLQTQTFVCLFCIYETIRARCGPKWKHLTCLGGSKSEYASVTHAQKIKTLEIGVTLFAPRRLRCRVSSIITISEENVWINKIYNRQSIVHMRRTVWRKILSNRSVFSQKYGVHFREIRSTTCDSPEKDSVQRERFSFSCGLKDTCIFALWRGR